MKSEFCIPAKIEAAKLAIARPCSEKRVRLNISGHDITFGLPDTRVDNGIKEIEIPSTPHIFKINRLFLKTERNEIRHEVCLFDSVILLGHGERNRDDPRRWFFEDGQDVVQLASDFNSLGNGIPPIKMIVSCRRVLSMSSGGKVFKSTRQPLGWKKLPGIILQKNGNPHLKSVVRDKGIFATVSNYDSDFIRVTKNGRIRNIRTNGL